MKTALQVIFSVVAVVDRDTGDENDADRATARLSLYDAHQVLGAMSPAQLKGAPGDHELKVSLGETLLIGSMRGRAR